MPSHHLAIPATLADWILGRRRAILIFVGLTTLLWLTIALTTPMRSSLVQGFMPDDSVYNAYRAKAAALGGNVDDVLLLATAEADRLFTPAVLNAVRRAAERIERLPEISRVETFGDLPWLAANRPLSRLEELARDQLRAAVLGGTVPPLGPLEPPLYWPRSADLQARTDLQALRQAVTRLDPLGGALVSADGRAQLMLVRLAGDAPRGGSRPLQLAERLQQIVREEGLGRDGVHLAGVLLTEGGMLGEVQFSVTYHLPLGSLITCLLVYWIFRRVSLVLVALAVGLAAVSWSVGVTALIFGRLTLLVAAAPLLILVISTSDTIHILSAYLEELRRGVPASQAVRRTVTGVGGACLLTSITTFVGFLSLMVIPATTIRHLSVSISVGVAAALIFAVTICPIALASLKWEPGSTEGRNPIIDGAIARFVALCKVACLARPGWVVAVVTAIFVGCLALMSQLQLDADFAQRFPRGHAVRRGIDFMNRHFGGANTIEVFLEAAPETMRSAEMIEALQRIESRLIASPDIQRSVSLATVLQSVDRLLGIPAEQAWTTARVQAALKLLSSASPAGLRGVLSRDAKLTRVSLQTGVTRIFRINSVAKRVETVFREELPAGVRVEASGAYPIIGRAAETFIRSQYNGMLVCFLSVMTIVGLGVRSLRLALLSIVPNLLPLVLLGGLAALTSEGPIDSDILGVVIVSFGLAVDDTIHFLHRYDIELAACGDARRAVARTFDYTGLAIVRTTVILGLGLSVFALSGYLSIWMLGTYLVFVLACAVLGDLLLLPALILLFSPRPQAVSESSPG